MKVNLAFAALLFFTTGFVQPATAQSLSEQERCAAQADKAFQEWKLDDQKQGFGYQLVSGDYQSHYNTKLQKCLMLIEATHVLGKESSTTAMLVDAYQRRLYAYYLWISRESKKYWEVPPTSCELIPSLHEKKICASREQFDDFVSDYLE